MARRLAESGSEAVQYKSEDSDLDPPRKLRDPEHCYTSFTPFFLAEYNRLSSPDKTNFLSYLSPPLNAHSAIVLFILVLSLYYILLIFLSALSSA